MINRQEALAFGASLALAGGVAAEARAQGAAQPLPDPIVAEYKPANPIQTGDNIFLDAPGVDDEYKTFREAHGPAVSDQNCKDLGGVTFRSAVEGGTNYVCTDADVAQPSHVDTVGEGETPDDTVFNDATANQFAVSEVFNQYNFPVVGRTASTKSAKKIKFSNIQAGDVSESTPYGTRTIELSVQRVKKGVASRITPVTRLTGNEEISGVNKTVARKKPACNTSERLVKKVVWDAKDSQYDKSVVKYKNLGRVSCKRSK